MSYYPDLSAYYAAAAANPFTAAAAVRLAAASPPMKRARVMVPPQAAAVGSQRTVIAKSPSTPPARKPQGTVCLEELKTYCTGPDILICGNCREMFRSLGDLLHHKREYCKLRFACKCSHETQQLPVAPDEASSVLLCGLCTESFVTAWLLLEHFQSTHSVDIYTVENGEEAGGRGAECDGGSSAGDSASSDSTDPTAAGRVASPQTNAAGVDQESSDSTTAPTNS